MTTGGGDLGTVEPGHDDEGDRACGHGVDFYDPWSNCTGSPSWMMNYFFMLFVCEHIMASVAHRQTSGPVQSPISLIVYISFVLKKKGFAVFCCFISIQVDGLFTLSHEFTETTMTIFNFVI